MSRWSDGGFVPGYRYDRRVGLQESWGIPRSNSRSSTISDYESDTDPIEETCLDAAMCRLSAVDAKYLSDNYVQRLVGKVERKLPIINKGTYIRTTIINNIVREFVSQHTGRVQIVSIGAGLDTRYPNMIEWGYRNFLYVEIDFQGILEKKRRRLGKQMEGSSDTTIALIGGNLVDFETKIVPRMLLSGFSLTRPTLVLSELSITYLDHNDGNSIIGWFVSNMKVESGKTWISKEGIAFHSSMFLSLEYGNLSDPFGIQMLKNLQERKIAPKGSLLYSTLEKQIGRYENLGWVNVFGIKMYDAYERWISESEKVRIQKLEVVDEIEELVLLCNHYHFILAGM